MAYMSLAKSWSIFEFSLQMLEYCISLPSVSGWSPIWPLAIPASVIPPSDGEEIEKQILNLRGKSQDRL